MFENLSKSNDVPKTLKTFPVEIEQTPEMPLQKRAFLSTFGADLAAPLVAETTEIENARAKPPGGLRFQNVSTISRDTPLVVPTERCTPLDGLELADFAAHELQLHVTNRAPIDHSSTRPDSEGPDVTDSDIQIAVDAG